MDRRKRQRQARLRAKRIARAQPAMPFGLSDESIITIAGFIDSLVQHVRFGGPSPWPWR